MVAVEQVKKLLTQNAKDTTARARALDPSIDPQLYYQQYKDHIPHSVERGRTHWSQDQGLNSGIELYYDDRHQSVEDPTIVTTHEYYEDIEGQKERKVSIRAYSSVDLIIDEMCYGEDQPTRYRKVCVYTEKKLRAIAIETTSLLYEERDPIDRPKITASVSYNHEGFPDSCSLTLVDHDMPRCIMETEILDESSPNHPKMPDESLTEFMHPRIPNGHLGLELPDVPVVRDTHIEVPVKLKGQECFNLRFPARIDYTGLVRQPGEGVLESSRITNPERLLLASS